MSDSGLAYIDDFDYCLCEAGQARRDSDEALDQQKLADEAADRYSGAGLPRRFDGMAFDGSKCDQKLIGRLKAWCLDEAGDKSSWYLWGAYGTGKTGLAASCAHALTYGRTKAGLRSRSVQFATIPNMLTRLRSTYGDIEGVREVDLIEAYTLCDVLILDDLGAEQVKDTGWVEDRLYQIIGNRHANEARTIFTSNISIKQLADRIGARITWRIVEMCGADQIVRITGRNLRDARS